MGLTEQRVLTFLKSILEVPLTSKVVFIGLLFPSGLKLRCPHYPAVTPSWPDWSEPFPTDMPDLLTSEGVTHSAQEGAVQVRKQGFPRLQQCWAVLSLGWPSLLILTWEWLKL